MFHVKHVPSRRPSPPHRPEQSGLDQILPARHPPPAVTLIHKVIHNVFHEPSRRCHLGRGSCLGAARPAEGSGSLSGPTDETKLSERRQARRRAPVTTWQPRGTRGRATLQPRLARTTALTGSRRPLHSRLRGSRQPRPVSAPPDHKSRPACTGRDRIRRRCRSGPQGNNQHCLLAAVLLDGRTGRAYAAATTRSPLPEEPGSARDSATCAEARASASPTSEEEPVVPGCLPLPNYSGVLSLGHQRCWVPRARGQRRSPPHRNLGAGSARGGRRERCFT
jgi:hypothetical protein